MHLNVKRRSNGKPFGNLVVGISTGPETEQALRFFAEHEFDAEVIGYVA